jgi:hypothetical protein
MLNSFDAIFTLKKGTDNSSKPALKVLFKDG